MSSSSACSVRPSAPTGKLALQPTPARPGQCDGPRRFKAVVLGVNYGMQEHALAERIGRPVVEARELLRRHRATYRRFWRWSEGAVAYADGLGETQEW